MSTFKQRRLSAKLNPGFVPRYYQGDAIPALLAYLSNPLTKGRAHPLIVAPTGSGKSHILAMWAKYVLDRWPDQRLLLITDVDTLIEQDYFTCREHLPDEDVGVYSAGLGCRERRRLTIAGIKSIAKKPALFADTTMILIDEAHMVPVKAEGDYRRFLSNFTCPVVGLTATQFRAAEGLLYGEPTSIFSGVAFNVDMLELIDHGYLCPVVTPPVAVNIKIKDTTAKDFTQKQMADAMPDEKNLACVDDSMPYVNERNKVLVFCRNIAHCDATADLYTARGVACGALHSGMSRSERDAVKLAFADDRLKMLVSVSSITKGFDDRRIDLIVLLRPTASIVLHVQINGRGMRTHASKTECVVLDYVGNTARLGPINDATMARPKKRKHKGPAPSKTCDKCLSPNAASVRFCVECGNEFEFKFLVEEAISTAELIATRTEKEARKLKREAEKLPFRATVQFVNYSAHMSTKGNVTLKVAYTTAEREVCEYLPVGTQYGRRWWRSRTRFDGLSEPADVDAALSRAGKELRVPSFILIQRKGKYFNVVRHIDGEAQ